MNIWDAGLFTNTEKYMLSYLYTRGEGSERKHYDRPALKAAREAFYRCRTCQFDDVRALQLDHVWCIKDDSQLLKGFDLLSCNCHSIKSKSGDCLSGKALNRDKKEGVRLLTAEMFPNINRKRQDQQLD